jgi:FkbM family methyltransferase
MAMRALPESVSRGLQISRVFGIRGILWSIWNRMPLVVPRPQLWRVLRLLLRRQGRACIVQVGAHVGQTDNDLLYAFLCDLHRRDPAALARCAGILVEPLPHLFDRLRRNYAFWPGAIFENVALADHDGIADFYALDPAVDLERAGMPRWLDQLGSLLPERLTDLWDRYEGRPEYKAFLLAHQRVLRVPCVRLNSLLARHGFRSVDLLQVDAEGYDAAIIRSLDFTSVSIRIINYERVLLFEQEPACRRLLEDRGYVLYDHQQNTMALDRQTLALIR